MSPLAAVALAREQGVRTVVHVSCRDRNRLALRSQVIGAAALGSEGVPFILSKFTFLGYGKDFEEDKHPTIPRSHELPAGDAVISLQ